MRNVHTRTLDAPASAVAEALDTLSTEDDRVWPSPAWWPMRLDRPLSVGAKGGHGPVRYEVVAYEPGRVRFAFEPGGRLDGYHEFSVSPDGPDRCVVTHVLAGRTVGSGRWLWPLVIRWCHDSVVEEAFDRVEGSVTGRVRRPHRRGPWVSALRRLMSDKPRPAALPEDARLAREAFKGIDGTDSADGVDYTDSFEIRLRPGMPTDPSAWAREIFFHKPFPTIAGTAEETLIGDVKPVDFRVSVLVRDGRLHMSTLVKLDGAAQRRYFGFVSLFHRTFVKSMLRRAVAGASGSAARRGRMAV